MNGYRHSPAPLRAYLERHGLTQGDFADQVNVCQSSVSQWLRGVKGISLRTAERIEKKTDREITVAALFPKLFARLAR